MVSRFDINVTDTAVMFDYKDNGEYVSYREYANLEADKDALQTQVETAMNLAFRFGGIEGDHHKAWVIDQMVRALAGDGYDKLVNDACGDDYTWEVGIAP